jgi:outer membrane protein assembly factor BamA
MRNQFFLFSKNDLWYFALLVAALFILPACNPYKQLSEGEYLLHRNHVKSDVNLDEGIEANEGVNSIIKQKANRRILGIFRFHLSVYTIGNKGKANKFKNWLKNTVGEVPVILDTTLTSKSTRQIKLYMNSHGYFNSQVGDTTIYKKKKAIVKYSIKGGSPYLIKNVKRFSEDSVIHQLVLFDTINSLIKPRAIYNEDVLQKERERLTTLMRNHGYFYFNQQYISYRVDTSFANYQLDIYLDINKQLLYDSLGKNSLGELNHTKHYINNIYVKTDYNALSTISSTNNDTIKKNEFYFISSSTLYCIKPTTLIDHINLNSESLFTQKSVDNTYRQLNSLGLYKFTNINFVPVKNDSLISTSLDAYINLSPLPKQDYKFELEGTNNGNNLGIGGDISYRNKNLFCGGENYEVKLRGALEQQKNFVSGTEDQQFAFFNTYEAGIENRFKIPKSYIINEWFKKRNGSPQTVFTGIFNTQNRPEFKRSIFDFSSSLEFSYSNYTKLILTPFQLNFVTVKLDEQFLTNLILLDDPVLLSSYDNHLIANGKATILYNNQELGKQKNFFFIRGNFELAGNSLRALSQAVNDSSSLDAFNRYKVFDKPFAQYIRPDLDLRYYQILNQNSSIVYRISGGIGIAYLNSRILPFEKSFYAGGSNDLRAYRARSVGPGAYNASLNFERIGDIKINANIEYRFDIFRILKGAFFADAGNIWLRTKENSQPGAEFKANKFLSQMAIGSGVGFRFDFTFFIFRLDVGVPLKDPAFPEGERWLFKSLQFKDLTYNLGIGYPF